MELTALLASMACSPPAPTQHQRVEVTSPPTGSAAKVPPIARDGEPTYDVHEWGLVRADQGDKVRIGAVAPPALDRPVAQSHPAPARRLSPPPSTPIAAKAAAALPARGPPAFS